MYSRVCVCVFQRTVVSRVVVESVHGNFSVLLLHTMFMWSERRRMDIKAHALNADELRDRFSWIILYVKTTKVSILDFLIALNKNEEQLLRDK